MTRLPAPAPSSPAGSQRRGPRAAERIRESARELFYRQGIRAVGVDEIVSRAGVTKPSLYRSFSSKDALAAAYLAQYDREFWQRFEGAVATHPGDPRAQLLSYLSGLAKRAVKPGYRGCGLTNAAVEYPGSDHPARKVAEDSKRRLRQRLKEMAKAMGATRPAALADGLLLLLEGAYASSQIFGPGGPAASVADAARSLIDANRARGPSKR
jgi:AcrR family transcriptional regulator